MKMWAMIIEVYHTILVPCAKNEFVPYGFALWVCAIGGYLFKKNIVQFFFYQVESPLNFPLLAVSHNDHIQFPM